MPRVPRPLDLTLLLLVAPFFAGCERQEERHCVGGDGNYVNDWDCEEEGRARAGGYHWIYVPRGYYGGVGAAAGAFRGATTPGSGKAIVSRGGFGSTGAAHGAGG